MYLTLSTIAVTLLLGAPFAVGGQAPEEQDKEALIQEALKAGPRSITEDATVKDWEGNVLRQGSSEWTCYPTPPDIETGSMPMCLDETWVKWAEAWANKQEFKADRLGIAYMLMGDAGASNTDPYATEPTADNEWVVAGPHLMILTPDPQMLEGIPTDPRAGGPWVMWKGTPYVHIMVPIEEVEMKKPSE